MNTQIDFVITWVDGADSDWRKEKSRFLPAGMQDDRAERYRDWENLKYWFRGVEKYAPWVRNVYFVTWGHLPSWLNTEHPKLVVVKHKDFIPGEFLPTFNSHTIEWNLHRIEGISEHFVYFNDDMHLIRSVKPEDFFVDGIPKDMLAFLPVVANNKNPVMSHIFLNNSLVLAKYFEKRKNVLSQPANYFRIGYPPLYFFYNLLELAFPKFTGFYTVHGPSPFCKETFRILWDKEGEYLKDVCSHRFRSEADVSQYLVREWQKLSGNFKASNVKKSCRYFDVGDENEKLFSVIKRQSSKMICINDANEQVPFKRVKQELAAAFDGILPDPSAFEKENS